MYYNLDIKTVNDDIVQIVRKMSKVSSDNLEYYVKLYLTDDNQIIITRYMQ